MLDPITTKSNKQLKVYHLLKLLLILFFFAGLQFFIHPQLIIAQTTNNQSTKTLEGKVIKILETGQKSVGDQLVPFQKLVIRLNPSKKQIIVVNQAEVSGISTAVYQKYQVGDQLRLQSITHNQQTDYFIQGQVKRFALVHLVILFIIVVCFVSRFQGILSLIGLAISFLVISQMIIPLIINGADPVLTVIAGATIIIPITFYISHGFNKKTHVGVIATFIALVFTGFLTLYFIKNGHLTGYTSDEVNFLALEQGDKINILGLLSAGIIISTLGVLDDITVGQASVIKQLKEANPKLNGWELFRRGMQVGQDHISSMINTLVLVYAGSSLPLLLLFYRGQRSFIDVIEFEPVAEEIVRMMVGSIGLVMAAPLATVLAMVVYNHKTHTTN